MRLHLIAALCFERGNAPSGCTLGSQAPASRTEFPAERSSLYTSVYRNTVILAGMTAPLERVANPVTRDVKDRRHPESTMRGSKITVHSARCRHPCRYDESWAELCITMSAERGNDEFKFRKVITDHTLSALITYNQAELEYFP